MLSPCTVDQAEFERHALQTMLTCRPRARCSTDTPTSANGPSSDKQRRDVQRAAEQALAMFSNKRKRALRDEIELELIPSRTIAFQ